MDIIAAHQQGLAEQLDEEVRALAGRPRDFGQRAIVLHHLFDHSRGGHGWALAEARRNLRLAEGLKTLERRSVRWGWLLRGSEASSSALARLAAALGEQARARTEAACRAYRLSATPALRGAAEQLLPRSLLSALDQYHSARRDRSPLDEAARTILAEQAELLAAEAVDRAEVDAAWAAIDATCLRRAARRLLGDKALDRQAVRDARRGPDSVERELRNHPSLPAAFKANPAQHFYALQLALADRRRRQWRELCDRDADAFELAA